MRKERRKMLFKKTIVEFFSLWQPRIMKLRDIYDRNLNRTRTIVSSGSRLFTISQQQRVTSRVLVK